MDLSVIIINWNSTDYLRQCLASVYRETKNISFEIVVVDNCSSDDSCSQLIRDEFPQVTLHCSKENLGFSRGCNLGYRLSTGETLLFLNPDTEIHNNVFASMIEDLRADANIGALGVRLLNSDGSLQTSCIRTYPTILNQLLDSEFLRARTPMSDLWGMKPLFVPEASPVKVDVVSGACLMVKRNVFREIGEFDSRYFMYVEDVDLCYRITRAGYVIHYLNDCVVTHHGGKSSALQTNFFANLRQQEALLKYFSMTNGRWYSFLYRVGVGVNAVLRLIVMGCLLPFRIFRNTAAHSKVSIHKWWCILRWTIGQEA